MSVLLRAMTMRSKIGFGPMRDRTPEDLIKTKRPKALYSIYYTLNRIDFDQSLKDALLITEEYEIEKPGKIDRTESLDKTLTLLKLFFGEGFYSDRFIKARQAKHKNLKKDMRRSERFKEASLIGGRAERRDLLIQKKKQ